MTKLATPARTSLERLIEGNQRFVQGVKSLETLSGVNKLKELAKAGQSPFSIILTCADSRAPAEAVFDRGFGDLFVLRVAGNIATPELVASIEFAVTQFNTPLCVVMGHTSCGAIRAAAEAVKADKQCTSENTKALLKKIAPCAKKALSSLDGQANSDIERMTTLLNIQSTAEQILEMSPLLAEKVCSGEFAIVEALYDLHTGKVHFNVSDLLSQFESYTNKPQTQIYRGIPS